MKKMQYLLIYILGIGMSSCLGNFDSVVLDNIIPKNFFKNEDDARAAVTAIYHPMNSNSDLFGMWESYFMIANLTADDLGITRSDSEVIEKFMWTSTTHVASKHYIGLVKRVSEATLLMDDLKDAPIDETVKEELLAEVKCARAQYMFMLYDFFGTAAIVTDPAILRDIMTDLVIERLSKADFVSLIEKDLKDAAAVLPKSYGAKDWGHFTQGAAYAILAKLYLQEKRWSDAEDICREIMKNGYELQSTYSSVFSTENEKNNEIIWAIPCLAEGGYGNVWMTHVVPPGYPLKNNRIQRWYVHNTPWRFYDKYYTSGDDRLNLLVGEFEYLPEGATVPITATRHNNEHLKTGALPLKYPEDPKQTSESAGNDLVIYRYADILLALAEVINEQNGPTSEAIGYVEDIRSRAGLSNSIPAAAIAGKDAFRDFILDERGRELFCEGHRRLDLKRHGKLISTAIEEGYITAKPHMVLFPLPQNVIDESKGKIINNDGY